MQILFKKNNDLDETKILTNLSRVGLIVPNSTKVGTIGNQYFCEQDTFIFSFIYFLEFKVAIQNYGRHRDF